EARQAVTAGRLAVVPAQAGTHFVHTCAPLAGRGHSLRCALLLHCQLIVSAIEALTDTILFVRCHPWRSAVTSAPKCGGSAIPICGHGGGPTKRFPPLGGTILADYPRGGGPMRIPAF